MLNPTNNILIFILALSFLLFTHELGHFLIGRLFKIHAEEFGFGYPPRLAKLFELDDTVFTLNWIPFGAFVRFKGEEDPKVPGGFNAANKWQRLATLLAGSGMNILVGILLFSLVISQAGIANTDIIQIVGVEPGSPAHLAGVLVDDQIVAVDNETVESMQELSELINTRLGEPVQVILLRAERQITVSLVPRADPPQGQGAMGIVMQNPLQKIGFLQSLPLGANMAWEQARQYLALPGMLMRGEIDSGDLRLGSPKGLYDIYSWRRESERIYEQENPHLATLNITFFFAMISVLLGITNLLPIPALDGGRILFILPEIIIGKRVPAKYENAIHMVGYFALLLLMGYGFIQDFINPIVLP